MTTKQAIINIIRGINDDVTSCEALHQMLEQQQRLLAQADADQLQQLNQLVEQKLALLANNARLRYSLLSNLGLPSDRNGMLLLLERLPSLASYRVKAQWKKLEKALGKCQWLNEQNGRLLAAQYELLQRVTGQSSYDYGDAR